MSYLVLCSILFFLTSRKQLTTCALVTVVQTCARPFFEPHHLRARNAADEVEIVRRHHQRRAEPVERIEQMQQPFGHVGIDVARRLVGDEDFGPADYRARDRSEEHTSELQSLMRISYAVCCLKKTQKHKPHTNPIKPTLNQK